MEERREMRGCMKRAMRSEEIIITKKRKRENYERAMRASEREERGRERDNHQ